MGRHAELKTVDGHVCAAYRADGTPKPRGGLIVLQEIFGVTAHVRALVEDYAAEGYAVLAPALFDRLERGVELPDDAVERGRALAERLDSAALLRDLSAAIAALAPAGKVGVVGYGYGGRLAYQACCHLPLVAGVSYYGAGIAALLEHRPKCPFLFHHGERDRHIAPAQVEAIKNAFPLGEYYLYPAEHGFNCGERPSYDAPSATLARTRTLEFFRKHIG